LTGANAIDEFELEALAAAYGEPEVRLIEIEGDEYLFSTRQHRLSGRRGEVVLAIERPGHCVLLHRKGWYAQDVFRLLSGGIEWDESVEDTLSRELEEETGLTLCTTHFLGVLDCHIHYALETLAFPSYVFHLERTEGELQLPESDEDIVEFRDVTIHDLPSVAEDLRSVPPPKTGWGEWRAIAHDFVYEMLAT
jgi:ADP-ribose pyrophosphatase YjhB (NUDIX family)